MVARPAVLQHGHLDFSEQSELRQPTRSGYQVETIMMWKNHQHHRGEADVRLEKNAMDEIRPNTPRRPVLPRMLMSWEEDIFTDCHQTGCPSPSTRDGCETSTLRKRRLLFRFIFCIADGLLLILGRRHVRIDLHLVARDHRLAMGFPPQ